MDVTTLHVDTLCLAPLHPLRIQSSDSTVLARLAYLYDKVGDESQSLHWNLESYRHLPTDCDVIGGIAAFFVQQEMFEKAIYFFQQAALVQPKEIKWSKFQSLGNSLIAISLYCSLILFLCHHMLRPHGSQCTSPYR